MPTALIDGIETRYEVVGEGPPLLMFSPGGFDATLEKWRTQGIYASVKLLDHLPAHHACILFDRRETGLSGGRVERVTWAHYVRQGVGLLDHLGIQCAHWMGGCMGCCPVALAAVTHPDRVLSQILYWPVGGARYRMTGHRRFAEHLAFVRSNGLQGVVDLARAEGKPFGADPRGGPWVSVLKRDATFAERYLTEDPERYEALLSGMVRGMMDRDTAPGAEPEDLMRLRVPTLIVPGADTSHALSAARYLEECIPDAQLWDRRPADQDEAATNRLILDFLSGAPAP